MAETTITQAVILAGGKGERLRPITDTIPKPMVPINGRPFLEYLLELLKVNGIKEVVLLLGYMPEKITGHFGDGSEFGVRIKYSIGTVEDETGTRIRNARDLLKEQFLLMYADNYWPMQLSKMVDFYKFRGVLASTTVYNNRDGLGEYGLGNNIYIHDSGHVFLYDKTRKDPKLNGVDIGFFILDKKVLDFMPNRDFSFEKEILPQLAKKRELIGYRTDHPYYPLTSVDLIPKMGKFLASKKVVFLDRDGVINKQMPAHDYVKKWEDFKFLPNVIPALQLFKKHGYDLFLVTNQRGIARGLMAEADLKNIHKRMEKELKEHGVKLSDIYYCPHDKRDDCECRKPKPGMLFAAARKHHLDLTKAFVVGDSKSDVTAGEAAGCKTILIKSDGDLLKVAKSIIKI